MEKTVVLVKPDGVKRGIIGEIITRFERAGLKIVALKFVWVKEDIVSRHYPEARIELLRGIGEKTLNAYKDFGKDPGESFGSLDPVEIGRMINKWNIEYLSSGPVVAMLLEGNQAITNVRRMVGFTHPNLAQPGTIRGDYSIDSTMLANERRRPARNIIHASGNSEEAKYEEELWFHKNDVHSYKRADEDVMF
ncbi:MAG: nucleoside-diphosphate kinase [Patescibacteria group bacterium]